MSKNNSKPKHQLKLIDISVSDDEAYDLDTDDINQESNNINVIRKRDGLQDDDDDDDENTMYLIHNECISSDDPNISEFLQFCMDKGLFDNTFYDTHNALSVVATKLPRTFEKLSKDGDDVNKKTFIKKFKKEFGYPGDINFIYNCLDSKKKGFITWDDFVDFFLPFIQYVTV